MASKVRWNIRWAVLYSDDYYRYVEARWEPFAVTESPQSYRIWFRIEDTPEQADA